MEQGLIPMGNIDGSPGVPYPSARLMDLNSAPPPQNRRLAAALVVVGAPLWVPLALLRGLMRICGDGLLYSVENARGRPLSIDSPLAKLPFDALAVLLFPIWVTLETTWSLLVTLSGLLLGAVGLDGSRLDEMPLVAVPTRAIVGVLMVALSPIWGLLLIAGWLILRLKNDLVGPVARRVREGGTSGPPGGRFETFVALRYMQGRKATGVSVVTGLTIAGVTVGVWTLVVVLSVMSGFEKDLQDKILGSNSHVIVRSYWNTIEDWRQVKEVVDGVEGVAGSTPFLYTEFMLRSSKSVTGAIFKGIDAATVGTVTDVLDNIVLGPRGRVKDPAEARAILDRLDAPDWPVALTAGGAAADPPRSLPGLLMGQEMAANLTVTVGDVVRGISPQGEPGPMGMRARVEEFMVVGIFHSGMYEYDTKFAYASLATVDRFLRSEGAVTGLEVKVNEIYDAPRIAGVIGARLRYPIWTQDWQKMNEDLFNALKLERTAMAVILTFIVAVACLNIISTLSMLVIEKAREIAILKAMGAGRVAILKLFMIDGLIVGFIGTVLGLSLGLATCWALATYGFPLSTDVYYVDELPVHVSGASVAVVAGVAVAIAFLATLYPSSMAANLDPVEGLRDG